jgi:hypothetical protein
MLLKKRDYIIFIEIIYKFKKNNIPAKYLLKSFRVYTKKICYNSNILLVFFP